MLSEFSCVLRLRSALSVCYFLFFFTGILSDPRNAGDFKKNCGHFMSSIVDSREMTENKESEIGGTDIQPMLWFHWKHQLRSTLCKIKKLSSHAKKVLWTGWMVVLALVICSDPQTTFFIFFIFMSKWQEPVATMWIMTLVFQEQWLFFFTQTNFVNFNKKALILSGSF